jgi:Tfp pilus assembly protein PilW
VTTPFLSELPLGANTLLAALASGLLLFVSVGVIYLSTVEWRDRRRRKAQQSRSGR